MTDEADSEEEETELDNLYIVAEAQEAEGTTESSENKEEQE